MAQYPYSLTIAIPAYNEEHALGDVIMKADKAARSFVSVFEILVIDDGSTDKTGAIADRLAKDNRHIRVIHHRNNMGFSGAIKACYVNAKHEYIFLLPADGQIDPADMSIFLEKIGDSDVVVGYRIDNPEPLSRRINSWVFHTLYRTLFGVQLREISTSILWRKVVLDQIRITAVPRSAVIEPEVVYKAWASGFRFTQVPIPYYPRTQDKAKGANPLMIFMTIQGLLRLWWTTRVKG